LFLEDDGQGPVEESEVDPIHRVADGPLPPLRTVFEVRRGKDPRGDRGRGAEPDEGRASAAAGADAGDEARRLADRLARCVEGEFKWQTAPENGFARPRSGSSASRRPSASRCARTACSATTPAVSSRPGRCSARWWT